MMSQMVVVPMNRKMLLRMSEDDKSKHLTSPCLNQTPKPCIRKVAEVLDVTSAPVTMYLPYNKTVYGLDEKSPGARRMEKWRESAKIALTEPTAR